MPVLVIDHESVDGTAQLARRYGAQVIERAFTGFVDARRFALNNVRTPWTLMIDADERLDAVLAAAMLDAVPRVDGYYVYRTTFFCGKPVRMWSGERLLRLFRTSCATLMARPVSGGQAQIHEVWQVSGTTATLRGALLHDSYPDLATYRRKFAEYTAIEAAGIARPAAWKLFAALVRAGLRFAYFTIVRGALIDGWRGIYVAFYSALYPASAMYQAVRRIR